jgi:hypothetical protein
MTTEHNQLFAALVAAQQEARSAPLDGRNDAHGYSWATASTMIAHGKRVLNAAGLALLPTSLDVTSHEQVTRLQSQRRGEPDTGLTLTAYDVVRGFTLAHISGACYQFSISWPCYLQAGKRPRDKAVAATDTTILSYAYRDLLGIGRMKEGEVDDESSDRLTRSWAAPLQVPTPQPEPVGVLAELLPTVEAPDPARDPQLPPAVKGRTYGTVPAPANGSTTALQLGATPKDEVPGGLVADLPADPGADDLEGLGWTRAHALQLTTLEDREPVPRAVVNTLIRWVLAQTVMGITKDIALAAFRDVGVDVKAKQVPTGYQLRVWAARVMAPVPADADLPF